MKGLIDLSLRLIVLFFDIKYLILFYINNVKSLIFDYVVLIIFIYFIVFNLLIIIIIVCLII